MFAFLTSIHDGHTSEMVMASVQDEWSVSLAIVP